MLRPAALAAGAVAALLMLVGCETGKPLPSEPEALEKELTARGISLWSRLPTLGLEGQGSVEFADGRKLEGHWRLIAVRGKVIELTLSSALFYETVARVTATPETVRIWLKPPGKREARVYQGPRQQLLATLGVEPWARDFAEAFTRWLDTWLTATAPTSLSPGSSGAREAGDALVLEFQRELGTANVQLRKRDGFPLGLETRPADPSLGCLSVRLAPERALSLQPSTLLPREVQGEFHPCCAPQVATAWRIRVRRAWTEVDPLPVLAQDSAVPRSLTELPQHEWLRRAGPLVNAQRTSLTCPTVKP